MGNIFSPALKQMHVGLALNSIEWGGKGDAFYIKICSPKRVYNYIMMEGKNRTMYNVNINNL